MCDMGGFLCHLTEIPTLGIWRALDNSFATVDAFSLKHQTGSTIQMEQRCHHLVKSVVEKHILANCKSL